jgi:tetratricopeptide (TPR) repeat protein
MLMKKITVLSYVVIGLGLCGCASSNGTSVASLRNRPNPNSIQADNDKKPTVTAETHFAAGMVAETKGDLPGAVKQYQEALKLDPKHETTLYRLGVVYSQLKQYDNAIADFKQYVKVTDSATAYGNLGFCCELAGRPVEAVAAYQKGIEKDPKNLLCRTNYGLMLARHDHDQEAIRMWQPVLTDAQIHYNLASVYEMDGNRVEAKAEYQKALDLDPDMQDAQVRISALDLN